MNLQLTIPKRGTQFYWGEQKLDVWLERVVSPEDYCVCDNQQRRVTDNYFNVHPNQLLQHKKSGSAIVSKGTKLSPEEKQAKTALNVFYASEALRIPDKCENCGHPLHPTNVFERRAIIAHILPKSPNSGFPTIATHPQNKMFLGTHCGCHNRWDNTDAATRATMNCYPTAVHRFNTYLAPRLTDKEFIKACTYLNINWK